MEKGEFILYTDKMVMPAEIADLMASVGWGTEQEYDQAAIERSLTAYPFLAHARDGGGQLVGYVTAFSDRAFSTFIGELVVRREAQDRGVGSALLRSVEEKYPGIPLYIQSFSDVEEFFRQRGYRAGTRPQAVLFKIPGLVVST